MDMESPPLKRNVAQDEDIISALTDGLLLGILERLELSDAVRAGAVSTRWRHFPHRLSRLEINARRFHGATVLDTMDAFTTALLFVCPLSEGDCGCQCSRAIKTLDLSFFLSAPHLSSIGSAVEHVVSCGKTRGLTLQICSPPAQYTVPQIAAFGQHLMSFSRAYRSPSSGSHALQDSDVTDLINACDRLESLTLILISCCMVEHSVLKIDTPCSGLQELKFIAFGRTWIELVSVPKLRQLTCLCWRFENPPVRFGYVPELRDVAFTCQAKVWQVPFLLSECLSTSVTNPWKLHLHFAGQMLSQDRHSCVKTSEDNAEKTNVVWEPSKDLKHLNLKVLQMSRFEEEDKVTNYKKLVMERAVGLKIIILRSKFPCEECTAIELEKRSQINEASWHRVEERLRNGSSSSVEIIIC